MAKFCGPEYMNFKIVPCPNQILKLSAGPGLSVHKCEATIAIYILAGDNNFTHETFCRLCLQRRTMKICVFLSVPLSDKTGAQEKEKNRNECSMKKYTSINFMIISQFQQIPSCKYYCLHLKMG